MGRKDIVGRDYFSDRERFAEILNVHLYYGNQVVSAESLICRQRSYPSLAEVYGEKSRDILVEDTWRRINYGMELETESDYSMPERIMVYDACEYEQQIRKIYKQHREKNDFNDYGEKKSRLKMTDYLHPTVTFVMYLGEGHWEGKTRISEMFQITDQDMEFLDSKLHDYDFLLLEADYVNPEDYQTDLKEFFQAMQCRRDRQRLRKLLKSENFMDLRPETELAIASHLNVKKLVHKMKKEKLPMCKAFDDLMKEERQNGKKEGRREGKREGKRQERFLIIKRMYKKGIEETLIREITGCTKKEFATAVGR